MRIIAGQWRGRKLIAPRGEATRPTADRVREALFSMLISRLSSFEGLCVADLFAGSGALGLEALSRGAASCVFVEQDRAALDALHANVKALGAHADIRAQSVLALPAIQQSVDLLLLDPPYATGAGSVALDRLASLGWLSKASLISLETGRDETVALSAFEVETERIHGKAKLTLLRWRAQ